ncbi:MAG: MerC domain-containing protein [Pseudomonadota bacterium]
MARRTSAALIDGSAITLSSLCLIHCLLLPVMAATLPIAGVLAEAEWLHRAFILFALPFSAIALTSRNITWPIGLLIVFGFGSLVAGGFIEALHDYEVQLTVIGGLALAMGHILRLTRAHSSGQA